MIKKTVAWLCFVLVVLVGMVATFFAGYKLEKKDLDDVKMQLKAAQVEVADATKNIKLAKADALDNLSEEEFLKLVKIQTQPNSDKTVIGKLILLEQYASEEVKKKIEKFEKEEKGQLTLQVQQLTKDNEQLKIAQNKASVDKAASDKTIADLQAQLSKLSSPVAKKTSAPADYFGTEEQKVNDTPLRQKAKKLRAEDRELLHQWAKAHTEATALELIHGKDSKEAKQTRAEEERLIPLVSAAEEKALVAEYEADHEDKYETKKP